jgi:hypothetical protein
LRAAVAQRKKAAGEINRSQSIGLQWMRVHKFQDTFAVHRISHWTSLGSLKVPTAGNVVLKREVE